MGSSSSSPNYQARFQSNGNVNLGNMCFEGDKCQHAANEVLSENYKCCRGFEIGSAMGLNMCVDITDHTNSNSYGTTYGYESLGILHSAITPVIQLNYNCNYALFV